MKTDNLLLFATALVLAALPATLPAAEIDRIEPPSWWQGFKHRELQLMVYGEGIAKFEARVSQAGISVTRIQPGDSDNYLFVYLDIDPFAHAGEFDIVLEGDGQTLTHRYPLLDRDLTPGRNAGFSSSDVIYLITPDRFANGDTSNDSVAGYADELNRRDDYGRHGGDIAGVRQHLDYIGDMGFTQVWLNPVLENAMPEASYHGYATTDFYRVDPRFGSNEDYRDLVLAAKQRGIGFIMDMIVNHIGSEHPWMNDLPQRDWINNPDAYRETTHARTTNQDPYASATDKREFADGWFVPTMPDLNQRNPLLGDYLVQNAIWWTEYLGLSGIRMDTYPYPDKEYMAEWTRRIMQEYPEFNIVGEEWSPNPVIVSYWQAGKINHDDYVSYLPSVMDFPIQIALAGVLRADEPGWGSVWTPVYEMLGNDFLYADPFNLVIFPDNHDMSRVFTQLDEDIDLYRMALVYYATMRGIPQFFYGTEILMSHPGTESHGALRADFPGGWSGDRKNAFTGAGLSRKERDAQAFVKKLLNWRKSAGVVHSGKLMQFTPIGNVYAYFRYDDDDTVMAVFNRGEDAVNLDMSRFRERIGDRHHAVDVLSGERYDVGGDIRLPRRSVLLLELSEGEDAP